MVCLGIGPDWIGNQDVGLQLKTKRERRTVDHQHRSGFHLPEQYYEDHALHESSVYLASTLTPTLFLKKESENPVSFPPMYKPGRRLYLVYHPLAVAWHAVELPKSG